MMSLDLCHKAVGGAKNCHYQGSISGGKGHHASFTLILLFVNVSALLLVVAVAVPRESLQAAVPTVHVEGRGRGREWPCSRPVPPY